ncbi:SPOR domain-containing protein [Parashewanella spongiae]|uniref:SPOR domain-containing protein n=1 Tax=Parashewanella spongiae TaxID=342950 RepID=A0A3A6U248_9GAMM|nr:SPOR domain-containing protein [Parashewanella spongiae]MCL1077710.1 SPOR domain-containing protein [Parashewanella spongiae]RJY18093.1 SPOR domain-containing protein [Parashewanella spongiae]
MSNQFQNRLVGTIVVVALGVIFLPDMLDGKKPRQEENFSEIPLRPAFSGDINKNNSEVIGAIELPQPETVDSTQPESSTTEVVNSEPVKTKSTPKKIEVGFTLQLGSFKNAANVNALVKKLRKSGFPAYTLPKIPVDKELTKVFVGPNVSKEKLIAIQAQVLKQTGLKGRVITYNPLERK